MTKTISANVSKDEKKNIEQYCKDNNTNQNDLIKKSLKNEMDSSIVYEPKQYEIPRISDKEIESKIKKSHDIGMKKGLDMIMKHFENNNCPKGNCLLCDVKYKQQENYTQKEIDKAMPTIKKALDQKWNEGIMYGIKQARINYDKF